MEKVYKTHIWAKRIDAYLSSFPKIRSFSRQLFIKLKSTNNCRRIKGKFNTIQVDDSIIKNTSFDICGNNNTITIGSQTIINHLTFYVRGSGHHISIGNNCRFTRGGTIWVEDRNSSLSIGNNVYIVNADISITESNSVITIGDDCMLATNIDIRNGDSHSIIDLDTGKKINYAKNIKIDSHVWIGAYVKILKGVNIGRDSVVGIGSIVTKNVSSNTVVAGIPAKAIKNNVTWDSERR
ncbi:MAG: acyltransferase [Pleurocapsa sp.]